MTSNQGKKTPGIDGVLWKGNKAKMKAALSLKRHGYNPLPLRRIYTPKKSGKKRPLSIPTMYDRAMQAVYKLALSPVAETNADKNSYGFREGRNCADAVQAAFNFLSKPNSATHIFEADIDGCFDNISKEWMLNNILMDKTILQKWLEAGYVEDNIRYPTLKGTPQGGIISPLFANMALVKKLNSIFRGWGNYHRHVVSSEAFSRVDTYVFEQLWRMVRRRHQNKTKGWLIKKYWSASGKHVFSVVHKYKNKTRILKIIRLNSTGIKRHIKIKADANPYLLRIQVLFLEKEEH